MRHFLFRRLGGILAFVCAIAALAVPASANDLNWSFGAANQFTDSPDAPQPVGVTVSPLTRGNVGGTSDMLSATSPSVSGTPPMPAYTGASGDGNAQTVCKLGAFDAAVTSYFEFTIAPDGGAGLSFTALKFGTRRTGTGPTSYSLRHSGDGYATVIAGGATPAASAWGLISHTGLTFTSSEAVTFRLYGHNGIGTSVSAANWRVDDITVSYSINGGGGPVPAINDFTPLSGLPGSTVTINGTNFGAAPVVRFNGALATGSTVNPEGSSITATVPDAATSGPINVSSLGGQAISAGSFTVIPLPAFSVSVSPPSFTENAANPAASGTVSVPSAPSADLTVMLSSSVSTSAMTPASVVIPAGQASATFDVTAVPNPGSFADASVTISASAGGYQNGSATITVVNIDAGFPVAINKYYNSGISSGVDDSVELLILGAGTAGSTADLRQMLLKDQSSNMGSDGGGKIRFNDVPAFSAIKAGTLIVLTNNVASTDINPDDDFIMRLGLKDPVYFTLESGSFDISTTEMVMIKAQGAIAAGSDGGIHALAGGAEGAQFTNASCKKLRASLNAGSARAVVVNNATSSDADYDATAGDTSKATGSIALTTADFGRANNPSNLAYILTLRGSPTVDGLGTATLKNQSPGSVYANRDIFSRSASDQTVSVDLLGTGTAILTSLSVEVPSAFSRLTAANVAVSGPGLGGGNFTVTGQVISITGAALASNAGISITISGLSTPDTNTSGNDGRYPFNVQTAGEGGTLKNIGTQPVALVVIPPVNARAVDANGVPLMLNKTVAMELVCTAEDLDTALRTSGYGQEGAAGINIFIQGVELGLIRGNRYGIRGNIIQFSGLTEINPAAATDIINLGEDTPPSPLVITLANLMASPEAYEGRLVRINGLTLVSGIWGNTTTPAAVQDGSGSSIDIRIQSGSTAIAFPSFPINLTAILGQFDQTSPFTVGYQLMPRTDADVESLGIGAYYDWAALLNVGGPQDDSDGDGVPNMVEYATGTLPNDSYSFNPPVYDPAARSFRVNKGEPGASDTLLQYVVEASTDLSSWASTDLDPAENSSTRLSVIYTGTAPRVYFRLKLVRP